MMLHHELPGAADFNPAPAARHTAAPVPWHASAACRRGLAALLALLLLGLLTPALAQETCGTDPATSPNHSSNYILGEIEGAVAGSIVGVAMHWKSGLVWKRCAQGRSGEACDVGSDQTGRWNEWMRDFMPKSFTGQNSWWGPVNGYIPNPATGPAGVDRLQDGTWRIAYSRELRSIMNGCADGPNINRKVFPNTSNSYVWSASPYATQTNSAWGVNFSNSADSSDFRNAARGGRLVRGGQGFDPLSNPAPRTEAAGSQTTFDSIALTPSSGNGTAWGGARVSGEGDPEFSLDGGSTWATDAIVQSGDSITVRMTAGAAGTTHTATLTLRSGQTGGTTDNCGNCGNETTTLVETTADFTVSVLNVFNLDYTAGPGGTLSGDASQTVTEGDDGSPVTAVPDANYHFTGWDDGLTTATRTDTNVQADLDATASFAIDSYTVTFVDWDAGVLDTQMVDHGSAATAPADPVRTGYTFTGWDVSFTNVTSDLVITAQYAINSYSVTFVDWDASVLDTQMVDHGSAATAPADPVRTGHAFTGWDVSFTNVTSDLTITAQYDINTYTVTASVSGDHGSISPASQSVDHGDAASITVTPDAGYHAVMPAGGDCPAGSLSGDQYSTGAVTGDCTVTVSFDQNPADGLTVQGGDGQNVPVLDGFPVALTVRVADTGDAPLQGVTVNFAAPASGASAELSATSAVTDASGIASVTATANEIAGNYEVAASLDGSVPAPIAPGGNGVTAAAPVVFALTNSALTSSVDLTVSPTTVPAGQSATFTATIMGSGSLTPSGAVDFLVDGAIVCAAVPVDAGGVASCTAGPFGPGAHTAAAAYSGDASHGASNATRGFGGAAAVPVPVNHPLALLLLLLGVMILGGSMASRRT